ncbi:MAG: GAF domain-containing protein [Candidatus Methylomirabilia bacterium]
MLEERSRGQAGQALQNAQLFAEREACRGGVEVLLDIARALASTMELKQVLKIIAQRTAQAVGAERCSINLWRDGHIVPVMSQFADGHTDRELWEKFNAMGPYRLEEVPAHAEAIRTKQPVAVKDTLGSSLVPAYWLEAFGVRSALVVPLVHQEEVIGTLNLDRTNGPHAWPHEKIDLAIAIASQAALAVENARLYGETQRHLRETQSLLAVGQAVGSTLELTEILRRVAREVARLLNADMVGAYMADPEGLALRPMAGYHVPAALVDSFRAFPIPLKDHPFLNEAWESKKPVFSSNAAADLRVDRETLRRFPHRSMLFVPVVVQDAPVGGLCAVWWEQERHFTPVETSFVEAIANQAAVAVVNARLYDEARGARDFLQSITENSADAIVTADLEDRITYFSPGAEVILGYRSAEILGRPVWDLYWSGPEEPQALAQRVRAEGQIRNYETAFRAKDDRLVEVSASLSLLHDPSGAVIGRVGVIKDITERKRAEEALRENEEQLRQASKLAAVGQLVGGVAHEINNPLAVIVGHAERLAQVSPDPRVGERARKILASAKRAARIIRELQSFVRPQPRQLANVHLPEVLERTLRLREQSLRVSGIRVEQEIASGLPPVRGDFGQLEQVVLNLLLNAEQAVAGTGEPRRIAIRLTAQGDRVRLAVADSGPGIPPDMLPRIFEPFFTTKPVGQGTGLGLSICYGIIQAHEGRIWAESRLGEGATVIVELPASRAEGAGEPPPAALPPLRRGHVLVVEDEDDVAEAFRELLELLGQEVTVAGGGEAGWERLKEPDAPYDVVTLDLKMPDLSGQTLWERLVAHGIPLVERVVFVTGDTADPETQRFLVQAGRPVLTKPVDQATFATLLAEWLAASQAQRGGCQVTGPFTREKPSLCNLAFGACSSTESPQPRWWLTTQKQ